MTIRRMPELFSLIIFIVAIGVWIGWFARISVFGPNIAEMNPMTALNFVFAALALSLHNHKNQTQLTKRTSLLFSVLVLLVAVIKLLFFVGLDSGIDYFFFKNHWGVFPVESQNRMAPNTAVCFFVLGLSLIGMTTSRVLLKEISIILVGTIALFAIAGYMYGIQVFYTFSRWIGMAPQTAFCFALMTIGVASSPPLKMFAALLNTRSLSAHFARRFIPVIVVFPLLIGWLRLHGEESGFYGTEAGTTLFTVLMILMMTGLLLWGVNLLCKKEEDLYSLNRSLEKTVEERISELRNSEEQVRQLQKMDSIGRLAGGVAHDFNNMLAVITLYCDSLAPLIIDERSQKYLDQIQKATAKANTLTKQLLVFSRQQAVQLVPLQLNTIITDFEKMLRRLIGENVDIVINLQPDLAIVKADTGHLEQVIMNLVVNARDAMPQGGKIFIETSNVTLDEFFSNTHLDVPPGDYVLLSVADQGMGMDKATQAKIFEPFFTTKGVGKGTGLGLSTVYGIVKQCKGSIWVYSDIGRGTVFKIYLPVTEDAKNSKPAFEVVHSGALQGSETVLIVEDDRDLRLVLVSHLQNLGYKVLDADNGKEALKIVHENDAIDMIVTDVIMPEMTGPEMIKALAEQNKKVGKVLFLSGYIADTLETHGPNWIGSVNFLEKPFDANTLARKIRSIFNT